MSYFLHDKAGGGEDTRPDHVGDDEDGGGEETDLPFKPMIRQMIFHRAQRWRRLGVFGRLLMASLIEDYR